MQDRPLEFGASACLPNLPEPSLLSRDAGFSFFLPVHRPVLVSRRLKPLTFSCRSSISFDCPLFESRNLPNATGTFWSVPWRAATPIDLHSVSRCPCGGGTKRKRRLMGFLVSGTRSWLRPSMRPRPCNDDRTMQSESTHLVIHKSCLPTDKAHGTFDISARLCISTFGISVRSNLDL